MSETNWDPSAVRAYLLAQLSELEKADVERLLAADPEYALFFTSLEDELVTDYVRGRLSDDERRRFERYYQSTEEHARKIQFARALARSFDRDPRPAWRSWVWASVAFMVVVPLVIWLFQTRTVTADLYPGIYRGSGQMQRIHIGLLTAKVRLRLHCNRSFSQAMVSLRTSGATKDLYSGSIPIPNGIGFWQVPAAILGPGEYVVEVDQNQPAGEAFLLGVTK